MSSELTFDKIWRDESTTCGHNYVTVVVGAYPQQISKEVNFLVVDCSLSYNAIIGRLTLNSWKAVTSTYHLLVKFPMKYGVGQVQGDQLAVIECYLAMLAMDEQVQTMSIEERRGELLQSPLKRWKTFLWTRITLSSIQGLEQIWKGRRSKTSSSS